MSSCLGGQIWPVLALFTRLPLVIWLCHGLAYVAARFGLEACPWRCLVRLVALQTRYMLQVEVWHCACILLFDCCTVSSVTWNCVSTTDENVMQSCLQVQMRIAVVSAGRGPGLQMGAMPAVQFWPPAFCLIRRSPKNFNFVEDCKLAKPRHYGNFVGRGTALLSASLTAAI